MWDRIKGDDKFWQDHGLDLEREKVPRSCMPSRLMKLFLPSDYGDEYNQSTSSSSTSFSFVPCDNSDLVGAVAPSSWTCRLTDVPWDQFFRSNHIHEHKGTQGTSFVQDEIPFFPSSTPLDDYVKLKHFRVRPTQQCFPIDSFENAPKRMVCCYCQRQLPLCSSSVSVSTESEDDAIDYLSRTTTKKEVTWADEEGMSLLLFHILPPESGDYGPITFRQVRLEI
jgi:hypothetical protein